MTYIILFAGTMKSFLQEINYGAGLNGVSKYRNINTMNA